MHNGFVLLSCLYRQRNKRDLIEICENETSSVRDVSEITKYNHYNLLRDLEFKFQFSFVFFSEIEIKFEMCAIKIKVLLVYSCTKDCPFSRTVAYPWCFTALLYWPSLLLYDTHRYITNINQSILVYISQKSII